MKPHLPKLVVFDMDGVLVDVSMSYRDTVRQTASAFLRPAAGSQALPQPLFRLADLATVKQSGGLNNDWDLTHRVLSLLFTRITCPVPLPAQDGWQGYQSAIGNCDVTALADFLAGTTDPLQELLRSELQPQIPFVDQMYRGDVGSGNIIKQVFQEIYLGRDLFKQTYGFTCQVRSEEGFIFRETLFPTRTQLEVLSREHLLAIATGRPRAEASHALNRFGLTDVFPVVLTLDDCLEEQKRHGERTGEEISMGKPHPYMLDAAAAAVQEPVAARIYVGDMPDDMQAAGRAQAGYIGVGMTISASDRAMLRERLLGAGAARVVEDFAELQETLDKVHE